MLSTRVPVEVVSTRFWIVVVVLVPLPQVARSPEAELVCVPFWTQVDGSLLERLPLYSGGGGESRSCGRSGQNVLEGHHNCARGLP